MTDRVNADLRLHARAKCETLETPRVARGPRSCMVLLAALFALTGCAGNGGLRECRARCAAECLGVQTWQMLGEYCTCDTRAVVPGCEVPR